MRLLLGFGLYVAQYAEYMQSISTEALAHTLFKPPQINMAYMHVFLNAFTIIVTKTKRGKKKNIANLGHHPTVLCCLLSIFANVKMFLHSYSVSQPNLRSAHSYNFEFYKYLSVFSSVFEISLRN